MQQQQKCSAVITATLNNVGVQLQYHLKDLQPMQVQISMITVYMLHCTAYKIWILPVYTMTCSLGILQTCDITYQMCLLYIQPQVLIKLL